MKTIFEAIQNSLLGLHIEARRNHSIKNTDKKKGVFYGRSPSLAPYIEKKFAEELSKVYPNYKIFIDYPIRLCDENEKPLESQNQYPDIMIVDEKNYLKAIIELKLDIGRFNVDSFTNSKRETLLDQARIGFLNSIVGRYSDQQVKNERLKIMFNKFKKILIVVTLTNEHKWGGEPKSVVYKKELLKRGYIPLFLLEKIHYNFFEDISYKIKEELDKKKQEIQKTFEGI